MYCDATFSLKKGFVQFFFLLRTGAGKSLIDAYSLCDSVRALVHRLLDLVCLIFA